MARRGRKTSSSGIAERMTFKGRRGVSRAGSVWIDDSEVNRALYAIVRSTADLRPLWTRTDEELRVAEGEWFDSEGGGTWAPLSPAYARWKAAHGGGPLMVGTGYPLSGALRQSLTQTGGQHIGRFYASYMKFGTRVPTGNLWKNRKGAQRNTLDANSEPTQSAIGRAVRWYADELGIAWRTGAAVR